jgi:hypothetical protein
MVVNILWRRALYRNWNSRVLTLTLRQPKLFISSIFLTYDTSYRLQVLIDRLNEEM